MSISMPDLEAFRGQWVAIDRPNRAVVAVAESHEGLLAALARFPGRRVVVQRVPSLDDPIFVGLG